jgi:membrane protein
MRTMVKDLFKKIRMVSVEALSSFRKNKGLIAASSLAFSATLALIPVLFLLTAIFGASIGSSERALAKAQELLMQMIPAYSQDIIREVQFISANMGTIGIVNALVLFWGVTPLVANMRISLGTIFRKKLNRPYLLEKLFDVAISIVFLTGLSAIAVIGVVLTVVEKKSLLYMPLGYIEALVPFFFIIVVVFLLYFAFSAKVRIRNLLIGSLITAFLWFTMTPAFHLFLTYNPGYGFAFGSFKSILVVIIWIYYSLVVFLLGAEIVAVLERDETVFIKKLIEGSKNVPQGIIGKYVVSFEKGAAVYHEGDPGNVMFGVLKGGVAIRKNDRVIGTVPRGKCFGAISFLLSIPRVASAVALEDTELVAISDENIFKLMNEYPEFMIEILREIALRLKEANKVVE